MAIATVRNSAQRAGWRSRSGETVINKEVLADAGRADCLLGTARLQQK